LVTSWGWVFVTDFASMKPVCVPLDDPADFSYYFDSSGRRACYLAPERFYATAAPPTTAKRKPPLLGDVGRQVSVTMRPRLTALPADFKFDASAAAPPQSPPIDRAELDAAAALTPPLRELTPAMDVFALGCVLGELFMDGRSAMTLEHALQYRSGQFDLAKRFARIGDEAIEAMLCAMTDVDPARRPSAGSLRRNMDVFPAYFGELRLYVDELMALSSDRLVQRVIDDLPLILAIYCGIGPSPASFNRDSLDPVERIDRCPLLSRNAAKAAPSSAAPPSSSHAAMLPESLRQETAAPTMAPPPSISIDAPPGDSLRVKPMDVIERHLRLGTRHCDQCDEDELSAVIARLSDASPANGVSDDNDGHDADALFSTERSASMGSLHSIDEVADESGSQRRSSADRQRRRLRTGSSLLAGRRRVASLKLSGSGDSASRRRLSGVDLHSITANEHRQQHHVEHYNVGDADGVIESGGGSRGDEDDVDDEPSNEHDRFLSVNAGQPMFAKHLTVNDGGARFSMSDSDSDADANVSAEADDDDDDDDDELTSFDVIVARADEDCGAVLLLTTMVCSALRSVRRPLMRRRALDVLGIFAKFLTDATLLQRVVPYVVAMLADPDALVRATAITTLLHVMRLVEEYTIEECGLYADYLLPALEQSVADCESDLAGQVYAESLAEFAQLAQRCLEHTHAIRLRSRDDGDGGGGGERRDDGEPPLSFDRELRAIQNIVFARFSLMLEEASSSGNVKRALMKNLSRFCRFFGRQYTNDRVLPLIIFKVLLNAHDWQLRATFLSNIVGISSLVGALSFESMIFPSLLRALTDVEEFVIDQAVHSIATLCRLGLFRRPLLIDVATRVAPMLLHPNSWIRSGAIDSIVAIAEQLERADHFGTLLRVVSPFLVSSVARFDDANLFAALHAPLDRADFRGAVRIALACIQQRRTDNIGDDSFQRHASSTRFSDTFVQALIESGIFADDLVSTLRGMSVYLRSVATASVQAQQILDANNAPSIGDDTDDDAADDFQTHRDIASAPPSVVLSSSSPSADVVAAEPARRRLRLRSRRRFPSLSNMRSQQDVAQERTVSAPTSLLSALPQQPSAATTMTAVADPAGIDYTVVRCSPLPPDVPVQRASMSSSSNWPSQSTPSVVSSSSSSPRVTSLFAAAQSLGSVERLIDTVDQDPLLAPPSAAATNKSRLRRRTTLSTAKTVERHVPVDRIASPPRDGADECDADDALIVSRQSLGTLRRMDDGSAQPLDGRSLRRWKPGRRLLLSVDNAHDGAITSLAAVSDNRFFATAGTDGVVRIWDGAELHFGNDQPQNSQWLMSRGPRAHRMPTANFVPAGGSRPLRSVAVVEHSHSIVSAGDAGSIQVTRLERASGSSGAQSASVYSPQQQQTSASSSSRYHSLPASGVGVRPSTREVLYRATTLRRADITQGNSSIVAVDHFNAPDMRSLIVYASASGTVGALDLRTGQSAWRVDVDKRCGALTCFTMAPDRNWLLAGSELGCYTCVDMRFHMPLMSWRHPGGAAIRSLRRGAPVPVSSRRGVARLSARDTSVFAAAGPSQAWLWNVETHSAKAVVRQLSPDSLSCVDLPDDASVGASSLAASSSAAAAEAARDARAPPVHANIDMQDFRPPSLAASSSAMGNAPPPPPSPPSVALDTLTAIHTAGSRCPFLLTGAVDGSIRFWDFANPSSSFVASSPVEYSSAGDSAPSRFAHSKLSVGADAIVDLFDERPPAYLQRAMHAHTPAPTAPPVSTSHRFAITALATLEQPHRLLVSTDQSGTLKIWR
jgi:phosphoinositide-3-kinase, regulatory subunit 4